MTSDSETGAEIRPCQARDGEPIAAAGPDEAVAPLKVLIAYDCVTSGKRAMGMLTRMLEPEIHTFSLTRSLWRLDLVHDPKWIGQIMEDAVTADLLILSAAEPAAHPSAIEGWVSAFLSRRRDTSTAIISLFGCLDDWSISIQEAITQA